MCLTATVETNAELGRRRAPGDRDTAHASLFTVSGHFDRFLGSFWPRSTLGIRSQHLRES